MKDIYTLLKLNQIPSYMLTNEEQRRLDEFLENQKKNEIKKPKRTYKKSKTQVKKELNLVEKQTGLDEFTLEEGSNEPEIN